MSAQRISDVDEDIASLEARLEEMKARKRERAARAERERIAKEAEEKRKAEEQRKAEEKKREEERKQKEAEARAAKEAAEAAERKKKADAAAKRKADADRKKADAERKKAEAERKKAEEERKKAEEERKETEKKLAEAERMKAEAQKNKVEQAAAAKAAGMNKGKGRGDGSFTQEVGGKTMRFRPAPQPCLRCTKNGRPCAEPLDVSVKSCFDCTHGQVECVWPELPSASAKAPDGLKGPARDDDVISISSDDGDKPARKKQKVTAMAAAQPPMAGDPVYNTLNDRGLIGMAMEEMQDYIAEHEESTQTQSSAARELARMAALLRERRNKLPTPEQQKVALDRWFAEKLKINPSVAPAEASGSASAHGRASSPPDADE